MSTRRSTPISPPLTRLGAAAVLAALALTISGCSSGPGHAGSPGTADASSKSADAATSQTAAGSVMSSTTEDSAHRADLVSQTIQRAVISNGTLTVAVDSVANAQQDAESLATGVSGLVASEQSTSDRKGNLASAQLVLRIPAKDFDTSMDALAKLGRLQSRTQTAEDVTTQVIDNAARVRSQRASVNTIRRLYSKATTIGEVVSLESELAKRQADLDSLEQQQKWLADQTALSTINLTLRHVSRTTPATTSHTGFLGGLHHGWHGLTVAGGVLLTAVGAVLPFAVLIAILGAPIWLVWRRRRPRPADQAAATPTAGAV